MTREQHAVYQAIKDFREHKGYMPSIRELSKVTDKAPTTVHFHLTNLEREGYIKRSRKAHGITLLG